jgi:hypothetical protein
MSIESRIERLERDRTAGRCEQCGALPGEALIGGA